MLGAKEFLGLPGSRASTWDKVLGINVKEFHDLNIRLKRKKIQEEYINLAKGKVKDKAEPEKTKGKSSNNQTSSMKTSSISSKS